MKERGTVEFSELPEKVFLEEALDLNKRIWRSPDRSFGLDHPKEVDPDIVMPAFEKVLYVFEDFISPVHKKTFPIVNHSTLPDLPIGFGYGYYHPNYRKGEPMRLFSEFGTDWMAQYAVGNDPLDQNTYLDEVAAAFKKTRFTNTENLLLAGVISAVESGKMSREDVAKMFANILLAGDMEYARGISFQRKGESIYPFADNPEITGENGLIEGARLFVDNKTVLKITKPIISMLVSAFQIEEKVRRKTAEGLSAFPGVINMLVKPPFSEALVAHEFLHNLSNSETTSHGVEIDGYRLTGGIMPTPKGYAKK